LSASSSLYLTLKALEMALQRRGPTGYLVRHSEQGSTCAADDYPLSSMRPGSRAA
jgi:hypothetical protein